MVDAFLPTDFIDNAINTVGFDDADLIIPKIKIVGVGGAGCNAVNRMIEKNLTGVEFIAVNTDAQVLDKSLAPIKVQIGEKLTKGLGAGGNMEIGMRAAQESIDELKKVLEGADMIFVTAGMGGGTGTGAAPVVAYLAKELGSIVIGVVTMPFSFEGKIRLTQAKYGISNLRKVVDTSIVVLNDKLITVVDKKASLIDTLKKADDVLYQGVKGISDLATSSMSVINVDFADLKSIIREGGTALMGIGNGTGDDAATLAVKNSINNPLVDATIDGARGVIISFFAGKNLSLRAISQSVKIVAEKVHPEANIVWGVHIDEDLKNEVKVILIATGLNTYEKLDIITKSGGNVSRKQEERVKVTEDNLDLPPVFRKN